MFPSNFVEVIEEESGNGLFTYTGMYTGSDPYPEGFPSDWSMATIVPQEIFTLHTKGEQIPVSKWLLYSFLGHGLVARQGPESPPCM